MSQRLLGAAQCARAGSCRAGGPLEALFATRSCQRQTQVLDLPVRRLISVAPTPVRTHQHDLGSPNVVLRPIAISHECSQTQTIEGGKSDGVPARMRQMDRLVERRGVRAADGRR